MRNGEGQAGPNPEGCQTVAGGRSVAQTPGKGREQVCTLEGCQRARQRKNGNELLAALMSSIQTFPAYRACGRREWPCRPASSAALRPSFLGQQRFLAPFQGATHFIAFPGGCAALRPPDTVWHL